MLFQYIKRIKIAFSLFKNWHSAVLAIYATFFFLFFLQFILNDALPGNCDSWVGIALANTAFLKIKSFLIGSDIGVSMYPAKNILSYGEFTPFGISIFTPLKMLGLSSVNTFNLVEVIYLSLSAFSTYLLTYVYTNNRFASFFAGFSFACSNFMFANLDESIYLFYFFPVMSLYFLKKFELDRQRKFLLYSFLSCGICVYSSMYVFIFNILIIVSFIFFKFKECNFKNQINYLLKYFLIGIIIIPIPLMSFYVYSYLTANVVNIWAEWKLLEKGNFNLKLSDLTRILPGNLIYSGNSEIDFADYWPQLRKSAFLGNGVVLLFFTGLITNFKRVFELFGIALIMLIISFGTFLEIGSLKIKMPMGYIYELVPFTTFFRVPFRAHFVTAMIISVIAAFVIIYIITLLERFKFKKTLIPFFLVSITLLHFFENMSFSNLSYSYKDFQNAPKSYVKFFQNKTKKILLDLPSDYGLQFKDAQKSIFAYNRDAIYISWQTEHKQNILGGVNGHFPKTRVEYQKYIDKIPDFLALQKLSAIGVEYLVFHPKMIIDLPGEDTLLEKLNSSPYLEKVFEDNEINIFKMTEKVFQ